MFVPFFCWCAAPGRPVPSCVVLLCAATPHMPNKILRKSQHLTPPPLLSSRTGWVPRFCSPREPHFFRDKSQLVRLIHSVCICAWLLFSPVSCLSADPPPTHLPAPFINPLAYTSTCRSFFASHLLSLFNSLWVFCNLWATGYGSLCCN